MGNGSPDVFSSISSFTHEDGGAIGLSGLIGAGIFVTTIVVGALIIIEPNEMSSYTLFRDIFFYLAALILLCFCLLATRVNILAPLAMFFIYGLYVTFTFTVRFGNPDQASGDERDIAQDMEIAFWSETCTTITNENINAVKPESSATSAHTSSPSDYYAIPKAPGTINRWIMILFIPFSPLFRYCSTSEPGIQLVEPSGPANFLRRQYFPTHSIAQLPTVRSDL